MFIEIPNYVDKDTTANIREAVRYFLPKTKHHAYNRDGYSINISLTPELKELDGTINEIFKNFQQQILAKRYRPPMPSGAENFEYHLYEPGDICNLHEDGEVIFSPEKRSSLIRYASVILHLNTIDEGGELIFPNQNKSIKTEEGKIVAFPPYAMFPHYTTPAKVSREIVVTWFVYANVKAEVI